MVKKIFSLNASLVILLTLVGALFGFTPHIHAQTVQDWSEPINLSKSGAASNPSMVVDSQGVLHVLWIDMFEGYKYAESMDGATWLSPVTVNFPFSLKQALPPVFLADTNGVIHIFWLGEKNELFYGQALGENLDSPALWQTRTRLDISVLDYDVHIDGQGRLHLGYVKNPVPAGDAAGAAPLVPASEPAGVFYRRSADGGKSWSTPSLLYESAYFRLLTPENARIRVAASDTPDGENVYAVWDDQSQKRIFLATSADGGSNWNPVKELITPQASSGFRTPYQADIDLSHDQLLVTWQVGEPGVQCTPYSWVSSDGGESWNEPIKILAEVAGCPEKSGFLSMNPAYSVVLFTLQDDLSISAWNGNQWSNPEIQEGPSLITNPATSENVTLGCERVQVYQDQLFVVGCDQGAGGDIWFMARKLLDPLENLFPQPSAWGGNSNVTTVTQAISSLISVTDTANHVHALWVQSSSSLADPVDPRIQYSRWNGNEWTRPTPVITDLPGLPVNLTLQIDYHQRLLLSWIDQQTGELMFSWANSERANISLEWMTPVALSSPSQLTSSPDMLVDASNRVVIAFAVTINEERGVYIIQSADLGATWSPPVRVFDAVSANWEMVDQPNLAVTEDGILHILFIQSTLLGSPQAVGLYYSQSTDGGITWAVPQRVNKDPVEWSEITAFKQALHRFWREKNQSAISTYHQVSSDGGMTWSSALTLPSDVGVVSEPAISLDWNGKVHLLQIIQEDVHILQEWDWSNENSQLVETTKLDIPKENPQIIMESGITSKGIIYALIQSKKSLPIDEVETSVLNIRRSLELTEATQPFLVSISTPSTIPHPTQDAEFQLTPTLAAPLVPADDTQSETIKNIVGLFLIVSVVLSILFFTIPRRNKAAANIRQSK